MRELIPLETLARYCPSARWDELAVQWAHKRELNWRLDRAEEHQRASGARLAPEHPEPNSLKLDDVVADHIRRVTAGRTRQEAAQILGVHESTVYRHIKGYGRGH